MTAPGPEEPGRVWGLTPARWAGVAALAHVLLGLLLFDPALFPGGDNAGYMILGEALGTGAGYRDIHLVDAPLHTKYPPLYPAVLALLGWLDGLQLYKMASLAFTAGSVWLGASLAGRWLGPRAVLPAGLLLAVNPVLLDYSHNVLSEAPFVFLVLLSLHLFGRSEDEGVRADGRDGAAGLWWAGTAAAAAAFLTRTAGLPLLLAAAVAPALGRRWRRAGTAAAVLLGVAGGWALFQRLGAPGQAGYLQELLLVDPYRPEAGTVGLAGLLERGAVNLWTYASEVVPTALTGVEARAATGAGGALLGGAGLAATCLAAWGWFERAAERVRTPEAFTFLYVGLIALWPAVWTDTRFLLPLLPVLLLYVLRGVEAAAGKAGLRPGEAAAERLSLAGLAAALLLGAPAAWADAGQVPQRLRCIVEYRSGTPCQPAAYRSFFDAARWTAANTPEDAVVVNRKPRLFYWVSGRRGSLYPYSSEPDLVLEEIEAVGADYVVVDAVSATTARYLVPTIEAHPARFRMLYAEGRPTTYVLRFLPSPGTARSGRAEGPAPARAAR